MYDTHEQRVIDIAAKAKRFYATKRPFRIYHGSTNSTRILSFKRSEMIDVSHLNHVLAIDREAMTAWVEPNVSMDQLVAETLKYGFVPKVVPEFPGITVGGAIQGGAGESSSFRHGCFNQICSRLEMVLGNGDIVTASASQNPDLFYGTAGSFGTLGIITAAAVELMPARPYVKLSYIPVASFQQAVDVLAKAVKGTHDFIDGIMFSPTNGVIIVGSLANSHVGKAQRFTRAHDQWYYLHAQSISQRARRHTEYVPVVDYFFRYDRGAFWVGKYAFELFHIPFNRLTRIILNPLFHTRKLYQALQESGASQQFIVQDLALPRATAVRFMKFVDSELGIYPLWLCPLVPDQRSPLQSNNLATTLGINVGVWGNRITDWQTFVDTNRAIEAKLGELGGKKWFYAHSYYTRAEFWSHYDHAWYDRLRRTYHAERLPDIFDKITVHKAYDVHMRRGAYRTFWGRAKLRVTN